MVTSKRGSHPRTSADFDREFTALVLPSIVACATSSGAEPDDSALAEAVLQAMATSADDVVAHMVKAAPGALKRERSMRRGFERRLATTWAGGFDALGHLCAVYAEYGAEYYKTGLADESIRRSTLFAALLQLHGRSCRVTREIEALLRAGLPEGAFARWRTLHEIAVTALVIAQEGEAAAKRYLEHDIIKKYKLMKSHGSHAAALKQKPPTSRERKTVEMAYHAAITAHGVAFAEDYGWAAEALKNQRPNFAQLEKHVRLERFRPYYSWSSSNVHAGPHGLTGLGERFSLGDSVPAGSTNRGLADPGQNTAISLSQIFAALMSARKTPFFTVSAIVIGKLATRCQDAFVTESIAVEQRTRDARKTDRKKYGSDSA